VPDFKPHCLKLAAQLMIPEAQNLDPLPREELVSRFVSCPLVRKAVSTAIKFDRQFCDGAVEIQKVDAAWVLAAESEVVEAMVTQQTPQAFFGVGGFIAKLAGEVAGRGSASAVFAVLWQSSPLPPYPDPLPRWGRGNFARVVVVGHRYSLARFMVLLRTTSLFHFTPLHPS
jgi:hypothetical protein